MENVISMSMLGNEGQRNPVPSTFPRTRTRNILSTTEKWKPRYLFITKSHWHGVVNYKHGRSNLALHIELLHLKPQAWLPLAIWHLHEKSAVGLRPNANTSESESVLVELEVHNLAWAALALLVAQAITWIVVTNFIIVRRCRKPWL